MTTVTPSIARGIHVTPRLPPFEFDAGNVPESWMLGDTLSTAAWNAISVIASAGEKLFVEAGRYLVERIDEPVVAAETRAFLQQEAMHSRTAGCPCARSSATRPTCSMRSTVSPDARRCSASRSRANR